MSESDSGRDLLDELAHDFAAEMEALKK